MLCESLGSERLVAFVCARRRCRQNEPGKGANPEDRADLVDTRMITLPVNAHTVNDKKLDLKETRMAGIKRSTLANRLDELAVTHGDSIAQSYVASGDPEATPVELTFAALVSDARRRANALRTLGVCSSDVVAFASPHSDKSYSTMIAGMVAGTLAPINYFLEADAIVRILTAAGARSFLVHRSFEDCPDMGSKLATVRQALAGLQILSFGAGPNLEGSVDVDDVALAQPGGSWNLAEEGGENERIVGLFHTGGTTGLPKLVPHTEAMYDAMFDMCGSATGCKAGETILSALPLFHASGALVSGLVPLFNATRIFIPSSRGFRDPNLARNYWRFVQRHNITIGAAIPTILASLATIPPEGSLQSLKRIIVGGAPLATATIARIEDVTGAELIEGWGMTETCGFSVMNPHGRTKRGSVGLPFAGVEVKVRKLSEGDNSGDAAEPGEVGEVLVRGSIVIQRYFDRRSGSFTEDGWLKTGDLGRLDGDGYLWLTGRLSDLIIRNGHNIDPAVIEEPAFQHPAVQLAAAVGKPDKHAGELPILYVQLKAGADTTPSELEAFVRLHISERAAAPKEIIVLPELPLSGPGKISKLTLRRDAIERAFQAELDGLALGTCRISVSTVHDERLGHVATLSCGADRALTTEELNQVARALEGYTVPFRWTENRSAAVAGAALQATT